VRSQSSDTSFSIRGLGWAGRLISQTAQGLLVVAVCFGLFWLVWIYSNGLRDPRYLDGWILAAGMALQVAFNIVKAFGLSLRSAMRWRKIHILVGYSLIAAFMSHSDFSLPDTNFEWALWTGYVVATLSGLIGTYLVWALQSKQQIESISYDRIPILRADLEREVNAAVAATYPATEAMALPQLPHDAWIRELYTDHLRDFFQAPRNSAAHVIGSKRPLKRLIDEIDGLSRYVDEQGKEKLAAIKNLVVQKDELDFARVSLGLTRGWLLVHVPVTYALIALSILHVLVVYAFSSGVW